MEINSLVRTNAHTTLKIAVQLMSPQVQSIFHTEKSPTENGAIISSVIYTKNSLCMDLHRSNIFHTTAVND